MRAVLCSAPSDDPTAVELVELPDPQPGPGEVRGRVLAAALNFPDLLMVQDRYQHKPGYPFVPGTEATLLVDAVGPGLDPSWLGRRCVATLRQGAFAEYAVADVASVRPVPPGLSDSQAAGFTVAALTAWVALTVRGGLRAGETLLVHGATGGVGLAALQLGVACGARVLATGGAPAKLARLVDEGAEALLPAPGFRDGVKARTDGRGADVIYDPVGGDVFDESLRCIAWGGRLLVIGFASGRIPSLPVNLPLIKGFSVVGVRAGEEGRRNPEVRPAALAAIDRLAAEGRLRPRVHAELPLAEARAAFALLRDRQAVGKVILRP